MSKMLLLALTTCITALASPVQWTGLGANDHWYELISATGINYLDAKSAATGLSYLGMSGHLATWSSDDEFSFILSSSLVNGQTGYWYGAERPDATPPSTENWQWVNGEGTVPTYFTSSWFIDFNEGAPDAVFSWYGGGGGLVPVADYGQSGTAFTVGYVVEYDTPEPGAFFLSGGGAGLLLLLRLSRMIPQKYGFGGGFPPRIACFVQQENSIPASDSEEHS